MVSLSIHCELSWEVWGSASGWGPAGDWKLRAPEGTFCGVLCFRVIWLSSQSQIWTYVCLHSWAHSPGSWDFWPDEQRQGCGCSGSQAPRVSQRFSCQSLLNSPVCSEVPPLSSAGMFPSAQRGAYPHSVLHSLQRIHLWLFALRWGGAATQPHGVEHEIQVPDTSYRSLNPPCLS